MSDLHLLRLPFDSRALLALCAGHGLLRAGSAVDQGYLVHAGLKAALGELAPKPFLLERTDGDPLPVLAYSPQPLAVLREHAAPGLIVWTAAVERQMPLPFITGRRLGFEVTVCPVVRIARGVGTFDPGSEQDAYVAWLRRCGFPDQRTRDPGERLQVYLDWLADQLKSYGVVVEDLRVTALRAARLWRQGTPVRSRAARRGPDGIDRASGRGALMDRRAVTFAGTLTVGDPATFTALLTRGIGRHRAFGFGLLLLRPARAG